MIIDKIKLNNFRCFSNKTIVFDPKFNIILGSNATGKTSIIEAIYCLSVIKSFRTIDHKELINDKNGYFLIEGSIRKHDLSEKLSFYATDRVKKVKLNNFQYRKLSDYVGYFNVVCFSALDFLKLKGSSLDRRTMFDLIFCQISKDYLSMSNYYKKLLKERNALLKRLIIENNSKLQSLLDILTNQIIEIGCQIIDFRESFIAKLSSLANEEHQKITNNKENLVIEYKKSVSKASYEQAFLESRNEELRRGYTLVGPHRDDYIFIINNKNTAIYGSQGQQRNALLSVKLAMADLIYEIKKEAPTLLLDDVFSELDEERQNALIKSLNPNFQTIITAASISDLNSSIVNNSNIIKIEKRSE